jgi:chromosome segregation ATPase
VSQKEKELSRENEDLRRTIENFQKEAEEKEEKEIILQQRAESLQKELQKREQEFEKVEKERGELKRIFEDVDGGKGDREKRAEEVERNLREKIAELEVELEEERNNPRYQEEGIWARDVFEQGREKAISVLNSGKSSEETSEKYADAAEMEGAGGKGEKS